MSGKVREFVAETDVSRENQTRKIDRMAKEPAARSVFTSLSLTHLLYRIFFRILRIADLLIGASRSTNLLLRDLIAQNRFSECFARCETTDQSDAVFTIFFTTISFANLRINAQAFLELSEIYLVLKIAFFF